MSFPRNSLRNFLIHARATLHQAINKGQKITLVLGNESADLDSLTSSILFAYIRSNLPPENAFTPIYVPVTNIPASDIKLRPEFLALLPQANLKPEHLITLDDLPGSDQLLSKLQPDRTKWILVDHNVLQGRLGDIYSVRVGGVIDHHTDEHEVPRETRDEPRIIKKSGSCTSLVTEYCRDAWDNISSAHTSGGADAQSDGNAIVGDATFASLWDAQIAKLAMASILIDTANLAADDKVTSHDINAVKYLHAKIMSSSQASKGFDRDQFYDQISKAKQDISSLELHDILRKDYKEWKEGNQVLGISSVVKPINFLIDKAESESSGRGKTDSFLGSLRAFAEDRDLTMFTIMTTSTSSGGDFQRELFIWALKPESVSAVTKFEQQSADELGLAPWQGSINDIDHASKNEWRKIWQQREVQHSRKSVAPKLREAMS